MTKALVVYKSIYGYTKKYAEWIAAALKADLFEVSDIKADQLSTYDLIIFGGGLYAGSIKGFSLIRKNFDRLSSKKMILFTVGLSEMSEEGQFEAVLDKHLSPKMRKSIQGFHLKGGMNYKELSFIHKKMMAVLINHLKKRDEKELSQEDKEMIASYGQSIDFMDESAIEALINYAKAL